MIVRAVKVCSFRAGADPQLARESSPAPSPEQNRPGWSGTPGLTLVPLDMTAEHGRTEVVRELIRRCGIRGCAPPAAILLSSWPPCAST